MCVCRDRGDVKVDTQGRGLGEDVADLRFEQEVKGSAAEAELVSWCWHAVALRMPTPEAANKRTVSLWASKKQVNVSVSCCRHGGGGGVFRGATWSAPPARPLPASASAFVLFNSKASKLY